MNGMHSGGSNRKLVGGVVVVIGIGLVITVLASGTSLLAFLPFLLLLACPLMMIFMMGSMGHHHMAGSDGQPGSDGSAPSDLRDMAGLSRDHRVWALRNELTRMAWRQEALRQTLEQVEAEQKTNRVVDAEPTTTSH